MYGADFTGGARRFVVSRLALLGCAVWLSLSAPLTANASLYWVRQWINAQYGCAMSIVYHTAAELPVAWEGEYFTEGSWLTTHPGNTQIPFVDCWPWSKCIFATPTTHFRPAQNSYAESTGWCFRCNGLGTSNANKYPYPLYAYRVDWKANDTITQWVNYSVYACAQCVTGLSPQTGGIGFTPKDYKVDSATVPEWVFNSPLWKNPTYTYSPDGTTVTGFGGKPGDAAYPDGAIPSGPNQNGYLDQSETEPPHWVWLPGNDPTTIEPIEVVADKIVDVADTLGAINNNNQTFYGDVNNNFNTANSTLNTINQIFNNSYNQAAAAGVASANAANNAAAAAAGQASQLAGIQGAIESLTAAMLAGGGGSSGGSALSPASAQALVDTVAGVAGVKGAVDGVKDAVAPLSSGIDGVKAAVDGLASGLAGVKGSVDAVKGSVDGAKVAVVESLAGIKGSVDGLREDMQASEGNVDADGTFTEPDQGAAETEMQGIAADITGKGEALFEAATGVFSHMSTLVNILVGSWRSLPRTPPDFTLDLGQIPYLGHPVVSFEMAGALTIIGLVRMVEVVALWLGLAWAVLRLLGKLF